MKAFIDDIYTVRIEYEGIIHSCKIHDESLQWVTTEGFFQWFKQSYPIKLQQAEHIEINGINIPLQIGLVTLTDAFDILYRYDGPLGAIYSKEKTDFYIYSPVAKEIKLILNGHMYPMSKDGGIYYASVEGDFAYASYYYEVRIHDTFVKAMDPYVLLTNHTSGVVHPKDHLSKAYSMPKISPLDAHIYELHVRDATIHLDVENKGLFLGLSSHSDILEGSVIQYIKSLGMTHIQLLPVFDFEGVDPIDKSKWYNWGYNPKHYFSLQSWFSSQPSSPKDTVFEFTHMIDAIHKEGLFVIMDVVYNHVFDHLTYPYDTFVPGYFYRHDDDYQMTNGSYCGNEVETRRYMVRRLIIDSLKHFVETYQIDGFRFDLMGLIDVETMQMIDKALREIRPDIMLYGEGWHMGTMLKDHERASQMNYDKMPNIAHFNDTFRNAVKGDLHGPKLGYGTGGIIDLNDVILLLEGSPHKFSRPDFALNYVECHDNSTLYDKLLQDLKDHTYMNNYALLSNSLVAMAKGITFFHAGQEMFRTKFGVENSYRSDDAINGIHYALGDHTEYMRQLIQFKKKTLSYDRTYEPLETSLKLILKNQHETYHVIFKFDEKPYTIDASWGILHLNSAHIHHHELVAPGMYVFRS